MFAALQKASESSRYFLQTSPGWNWVPIAVFPEDSGNSSTVEKSQNQLTLIPSAKLGVTDTTLSSTETTLEWFDIPLSDDEDQFSPRGILEFRKISECDTAQTPDDDRNFDEVFPMNSDHSTNQQQINCLEKSNKDIVSTTNIMNEVMSKVGAEHEINELDFEINNSKTLPIPIEKQITVTEMKRMEVKKIEIHSNEDTMGGNEVRKEEMIEKSQKSDECIIASNGPRIICHSSIQTDPVHDEFSATKSALQSQLADAMKALEITRSNADNMRDRMRTYTSSMKQQAEDLRSSSRALSTTLDKVAEYKTKWKEEKLLKDDAIRRSDEQTAKVKELLAEEAKLILFRQGYDRLCGLLKCDDESVTTIEKLTAVSNKVRKLLDSVDRLQVEATIAKSVHEVEMNERLRGFEAERKSFGDVVKSKDKIFEAQMGKIQLENNKLMNEIALTKKECHDIRASLCQANQNSVDRDKKLKESADRIKELESILSQNQQTFSESLSTMKMSLEEKNILLMTLQEENKRLIKEKGFSKDVVASLPEQSMNILTQMADKSTDCNLVIEDWQGNQFTDCFSHSSLRSSSSVDDHIQKLHEFQNQKSQLVEQIDEMREALECRKREILAKDDEYRRIYADFRHLRWVFHQQEITVQYLRSENTDLRKSIIRLQNESNHSPNKHDPSSSDERSSVGCCDDSPRSFHQFEKTWPPERYHDERRVRRNSSGSEPDRSRLQTILESADENSPQKIEAKSDDELQNLVPSSGMTCSSAPIRNSVFKASEELSSKQYNTHLAADSKNDFMTSTPVRKKTSLSRSVRDNTLSSSSSESPEQARRPPKPKRTRNVVRLPIWRQENPGNKYSVVKGQREKIAFSSSSSSDSDELFSPAHNSSNTKYSKRLQKSESSLLEGSAASEPQRLVGIPMSEIEFQKLVGSMNNNHTQRVNGNVIQNTSSVPSETFGDSRWMDDGYSSSSADPKDSTYSNELQHSSLSEKLTNSATLDHLHPSLLFSYSEIPAGISAPNTVDQDNRVPSTTSDGNTSNQYFVTYKGITFDVCSFDVTQMRQIAWDAGFSESQTEMNNYIDFLAEIAQDLDNDPDWCDKHSLGRSSDWLDLKGHFTSASY